MDAALSSTMTVKVRIVKNSAGSRSSGISCREPGLLADTLLQHGHVDVGNAKITVRSRTFFLQPLCLHKSTLYQQTRFFFNFDQTPSGEIFPFEAPWADCERRYHTALRATLVGRMILSTRSRFALLSLLICQLRGEMDPVQLRAAV